MSEKKIFTYVSPRTNHEEAKQLCTRLPVKVEHVTAVEELFPLLSNPYYHTDFIGISIEMFYNREDKLDMFDIIHTLSTLIKSTVCKDTPITRPKKRDTKILVVVDETAEVKLIKEVMSFPDITSVCWLLTKREQIPETLKHMERLIAGDHTSDPRVLEFIKPKKKAVVVAQSSDSIKLTLRQSQVLSLVQERGASNKTIARILGLSESTVKLHIGAILKKFSVKNRTQLAVFSKDRIQHISM